MEESMIGDKLVLEEGHKIVGQKICDAISDEILKHKANGSKYTISIAGESGAGKSEIAFVLHEKLKEKGINTEVLAQDDYFVFPPKTNHRFRGINIEQTGLSEVKLDLIDANLLSFKQKVDKIYKPLVIYDDDKITHEEFDVGSLDCLIAEGTYTTSLKYIDKRVFIDRTYFDSEEKRKKRARDKDADFINDVLEREHQIILKHKKLANIIINKEIDDISVL